MLEIGTLAPGILDCLLVAIGYSVVALVGCYAHLTKMAMPGLYNNRCKLCIVI
jgi:hypothetical protein